MKKIIFSSITLILFLVLGSPVLLAQEIKSASGIIVEVSQSSSLGQIGFDLQDQETEQLIHFVLWSGQFDVTETDQLLNKSVALYYFAGYAPLAIGISKINDPMETDYFQYEGSLPPHTKEFHFVGMYKGATEVNYQTRFNFEGANGRIEEFAIPEKMFTDPFYDGTYENEEWVVTYVLVDDNYLLEIDWVDEGKAVSILEEVEPIDYTFTGIVTDYSDSGLGPYYNLNVKNQETSELFYALVYIDYVPRIENGSIIGKKVNVFYGYEYENQLISIELKSKFDRSKVESEPDMKEVEGTFESCEIGDMGGYLYITTNDGDSMIFMTDFSCPDQIKEGDKVIALCRVEKKPDVTGVELVK